MSSTSHAVIPDETAALVAYLRSLPVGTTASYAEIEQAVGFPVHRKARGSFRLPGPGRLAVARRILKRDHLIVVGTVRMIGLRILDGAERQDLAHSKTTGIARRARDARTIALAIPDGMKLSEADRHRQHCIVAVTGCVEALAGSKTITNLIRHSRPTVSNMPDLNNVVASIYRAADRINGSSADTPPDQADLDTLANGHVSTVLAVALSA